MSTTSAVSELRFGFQIAGISPTWLKHPEVRNSLNIGNFSAIAL